VGAVRASHLWPTWAFKWVGSKVMSYRKDVSNQAINFCLTKVNSTHNVLGVGEFSRQSILVLLIWGIKFNKREQEN